MHTDTENYQPHTHTHTHTHKSASTVQQYCSENTALDYETELYCYEAMCQN